MTSPLKPRPRPSWSSLLLGVQIGPMAEDLLGVSLAAAAAGAGSVGRPRLDKGVDLYLRRLGSMFIIPFQVKSSIVLTQDATSTDYIPEHDLRTLKGGYLAFAHIPKPHDQLYSRLFLIPEDEFRKRAELVVHEGEYCYQFVGKFAGTVEERWSSFAINIDHLPEWLASVPGW